MEISNHLKKSLAEVLTLYYPLAGRIRFDNHFVDCNDEGVPYLEAQVTNCRVRDVLENPIPGELNKLVPFQLGDGIADDEIALGVQLNMFECGGFAIGLSTTHKLADGLSMLMFSRTWAATARGDSDQVEMERPEFVSAKLFPPKDLNHFSTRDAIAKPVIDKNKVTKRFVFGASNIEDLRAKYTSLSEKDVIMKPPISRVETLSAFIWRRFVEAIKDDDHNKLHRVIHAVNLRPLIDPPLPRHTFGNIFRLAMTAPFLSGGNDEDEDEDDEESCYGMVRRVREEINKIDKDYVKRLQEGDEKLTSVNPLAHSFTRGEVETSNFTSLCRFPLYDNDFGWGRPTWVGIPPLPLNNLTVFLDTKEAGGIEAYVTLEEEVMTKFESDPFLQRRVCTGRFDTAVSSLAHQPARLNQVAKFHSQNRSSVIKKPIQIKPSKLESRL
ncbi:vinorine synthase-like [Prunus yedoensis var. nudiflora]|uniref:Vinorine synthase-like n=1 Tax=Prunus yedoensis var. nudiflora TaxID=2094558 RepID=A0A314ZBQ9_PRUYE|nr:vinorine synthase-like [Prunus yedoensis var. nudiflora]